MQNKNDINELTNDQGIEQTADRKALLKDEQKKQLDAVKKYMPSFITLPKSRLLRYTISPERGATNYRATMDSIVLKCSDKREHCKRVSELAKQIREYAIKIAAENDKDKKELLKSASKKVEEEFNKLFSNDSSPCHGCKLGKALRASVSNGRKDLTRYGTDKISKTQLKVFVALHGLLKVTSKDDCGDYRQISLDRLAVICGISTRSVIRALDFWEKDGYISYFKLKNGCFMAAFTHIAEKEMFGKAMQGGAGNITLPYATYSLLLEQDNLDNLRIFSLCLVNLDTNLFSSNYKPLTRGESEDVEVTADMLHFVRTKRKASIKKLIKDFNDQLNDGVEERFRDIELTPLKGASSNKRKRFGDLKFRLSCFYAPIQTAFKTHLSTAKDRLTRSDDLRSNALREIEKAKNKIYGTMEEYSQDENSPMKKILGYYSNTKRLFPLNDGKPDLHRYPIDDLLKRFSPTSVKETLVPVLEKIQNDFGFGFLEHAIFDTFIRFRDELNIFDQEMDSDSRPKIIGLMDELGKYMYTIAKENWSVSFSSKLITE